VTEITTLKPLQSFAKIVHINPAALIDCAKIFSKLTNKLVTTPEVAVLKQGNAQRKGFCCNENWRYKNVREIYCACVSVVAGYFFGGLWGG
jgi:hypothetical protein